MLSFLPCVPFAVEGVEPQALRDGELLELLIPVLGPSLAFVGISMVLMSPREHAEVLPVLLILLER